MDNKDRFYAWLKAAIIIIWASVALGTTFAVWNAGAGEAPNGFIKAVAGFNLPFNILGIILVAKSKNPFKTKSK